MQAGLYAYNDTRFLQRIQDCTTNFGLERTNLWVPIQCNQYKDPQTSEIGYYELWLKRTQVFTKNPGFYNELWSTTHQFMGPDFVYIRSTQTHRHMKLVTTNFGYKGPRFYNEPMLLQRTQAFTTNLGILRTNFQVPISSTEIGT